MNASFLLSWPTISEVSSAFSAILLLNYGPLSSCFCLSLIVPTFSQFCLPLLDYFACPQFRLIFAHFQPTSWDLVLCSNQSFSFALPCNYNKSLLSLVLSAFPRGDLGLFALLRYDCIRLHPVYIISFNVVQFASIFDIVRRNKVQIAYWDKWVIPCFIRFYLLLYHFHWVLTLMKISGTDVESASLVSLRGDRHQGHCQAIQHCHANHMTNFIMIVTNWPKLVTLVCDFSNQTQPTLTRL